MQLASITEFGVIPIPFVLVCSFLGLIGQLIRGLIGIYKSELEEDETGKMARPVDKKRFIISLILGAFIGAFLCLVFNIPLSKTDIIAIISAGYAGTDFIEGFLTKRAATVK